MLDPVALASITSAISIVGNDYLKGVATEAGKASWEGIKALLGWASDPALAEIPEKVSNAVATSPEITEKLLHLLKRDSSGAASRLISRLEVSGGKVVVANTIVTGHFQM